MTATCRLTVALLTYRRQDLLAAGLPAIVEQARQAAERHPGLSVEVLVVDNDQAPSARDVVASCHDQSIQVRYAHEPTPGIAAARNRVLDETRDTDLVAFIDDDEVPAADWLTTLLDAKQRYDAGAVHGLVVAQFAREPDPWLLAGRFFQRPARATGAQLRVAATQNLLLDMAEVRRVGVRFDERLGLSGGEDTLFTLRLSAAGVRIVRCNEAVVVDPVPAERMTRGWVLRRAVSHGNGAAIIDAVIVPTGVARLGAGARVLAEAIARMAIGGARWTAGRVARSDFHQARGAKIAARGLGMTLGALGLVYLEYSRDGRRLRRFHNGDSGIAGR